jgi:hypothetical protein
LQTPLQLMTADLVVKVCVIGPLKAGKTLLCQTLAEQPGSLYSPTAGCRCVHASSHAFKFTTKQSLGTFQHDCYLPCRIQVLGRDLAQDSVTVQLWEVAGDGQYQAAWPVLAKVCSRGCLLPLLSLLACATGCHAICPFPAGFILSCSTESTIRMQDQP